MKKKTIRLYHGTSNQFHTFDLGHLKAFSEGVGLYSTRDMTYAMSYTSVNTGTSRGLIKTPTLNNATTLTPSKLRSSAKHKLNRVFYFDCPTDLINREEDKHIKFIDFYSLERSLGLEFADIKAINFNQPDFQVFSDIMQSALNWVTSVKGRRKIMQKGFAFMNKFGYNVIEVKQFHRHMTDRFYLIVNYSLIKKGRYYEIGEF